MCPETHHYYIEGSFASYRSVHKPSNGRRENVLVISTVTFEYLGIAFTKALFLPSAVVPVVLEVGGCDINIMKYYLVSSTKIV